MGQAPAAKKPAQAQDQQANLTELMSLMGGAQEQHSAQTPKPGQQAELQKLLEQITLQTPVQPAPQNGTPSEQKVSLASQNGNKPAPIQAPTEQAA